MRLVLIHKARFAFARPPDFHPMRHPFLKSVRTAFLAGVIVLAPLAVTIFVFNWLVGVIGGRYREVFFSFVGEDLLTRRQLIPIWDFFATIIVLLLITLLGYLSRYVVARFFFTQAERLMNRVPFISTVYNTAKQIVGTFTTERRAVFQKVVLIPFPRIGSYAIGFLTNRAQGEAQARTTEEVWNVFVPTTPNPTSGFLILVPSRDIIEMEMSIGDAMKLVISGGAVAPVWPPITSTDQLAAVTGTKPAMPEGGAQTPTA
jgi:uncharacterized membrane protein